MFRESQSNWDEPSKWCKFRTWAAHGFKILLKGERRQLDSRFGCPLKSPKDRKRNSENSNSQDGPSSSNNNRIDESTISPHISTLSFRAETCSFTRFLIQESPRSHGRTNSATKRSPLIITKSLQALIDFSRVQNLDPTACSSIPPLCLPWQTYHAIITAARSTATNTPVSHSTKDHKLSSWPSQDKCQLP